MKKLFGLCFIIACGLDAFAADSNKFTLNTKREDFVITGFDSRICDGPYNGGGRKAYLLPNYVGVGAGIKFKVKTESKDIVGYIYSDNPDTVVHSDTHSFSIYNLSPGQKLTVRGVDKDGFKTPEFRANFDVIPVPPWAMVALDVTANRVMENGKTLRYSVGEASWTWESNVKNWSGGIFPTDEGKGRFGRFPEIRCGI